jgi:hypothetical protein
MEYCRYLRVDYCTSYVTRTIKIIQTLSPCRELVSAFNILSLSVYVIFGTVAILELHIRFRTTVAQISPFR